MEPRAIVGMLLEDEGRSFVTKFDDTGRVNLVGTDYALSGVDGKIEWSLDIDARSWGVKEMTPIVNSVTLHLILDDYAAEDTEEHYETIEYRRGHEQSAPEDSDDPKQAARYYQSDYKVAVEWNPSRKSSSTFIAPTEIEIDRRTNTITVTFA